MFTCLFDCTSDEYHNVQNATHIVIICLFVFTYPVKMILNLFLFICTIFGCFASNTTAHNNHTHADEIWIHHVVALHRANPYPTSVISPDISFYGQIFGPDIRTNAEHSHFLITDLFIWDPIRQFALNGPECTECKKQMNHADYSVYFDGGFSPRSVIRTNGPLSVISARYSCPSRHTTILSTHPQYLQSLPPFVLHHFPFTLTHRAAIENQYAYNIEKLVIEGVGISSICDVWNDFQEHWYDSCESLYIDWQKWHNQPIDPFPEFTPDVESHRNYITQLIIDQYKRKTDYWNYCFTNIEHDGIISIDHTYKLASKIRLLIDNKHYSIPSAYYIIMSENRPLLFRFCDSESLESVRDLHEAIQSIKPVKMIISDRCCADANFLLSVHPRAKIKFSNKYLPPFDQIIY